MSAAPKLTADYIVGRIDELPTLPTIVNELNQAINDPMASTKEVERIMSYDASLTAKVLKLANSAYYAIPGGVSSLGRAVAFLGYDTIYQLVLSATIFDALKADPATNFDIKQFWLHSLGVGIASETIAKYVSHPMPSDLFTCGIVHDIGKLGLFILSPNDFNYIITQAHEKQLSYFEVEATIADFPNHARIGGLLAKKWTLPLQIQTAILYHHQKDHSMRGGASTDFNRNVDIVYLANILIHALKFGNSGHKKIINAPVDLLQRLTIDPQTGFKGLLLKVKSSLDGASEFLKVLESK